MHPDRNSNLWHRRRARAARRFRAAVVTAGVLAAVFVSSIAVSAGGGIPAYRIVHVPGARACGRAIPVDHAQAERYIAAIRQSAPPSVVLHAHPQLPQEAEHDRDVVARAPGQ